MPLSKPAYYSQTDKAWASIMYSNPALNNPAQTIGSAGCGPTCAAMVIATLKENGITPKDTAAWSVRNGYRTKTQGTEFAYFVPQLAQYGIPCEYTWDYAKALQALKSGLMVIGRATKGLWTSAGHFILAYALDGGQQNVYINDPNSVAANRSFAPLLIFKQQVSPFWIIKEEDWRMQASEYETLLNKVLLPYVQAGPTEVLFEGQRVTVDRILKNGTNYIRLRDLELLGFVVGYDEAQKMPVLSRPLR